jgi:hypothetical protein
MAPAASMTDKCHRMCRPLQSWPIVSVVLFRGRGVVFRMLQDLWAVLWAQTSGIEHGLQTFHVEVPGGVAQKLLCKGDPESDLGRVPCSMRPGPYSASVHLMKMSLCLLS